MSFAGNSVKTPAMAAVHGLRQIAFNTIGDKVLKPLVEYAPPDVSQVAGSAEKRAQQAAGAARSAAGGAARQATDTARPALSSGQSAIAGGAQSAMGDLGAMTDSARSSAIAGLPELTPQTPFVPPDFAKMPTFDSSSILQSVADRAQQLMGGLPQTGGLAAAAKQMAMDKAQQALPGGVQRALDTARGALPGGLPSSMPGQQQVADALAGAAKDAVPTGAQDALQGARNAIPGGLPSSMPGQQQVADAAGQAARTATDTAKQAGTKAASNVLKKL
jgi:hypothetical protein